MHWTWNVEQRPELSGPPENLTDYVGFIYKITLPTGQFYIGRKTFWSTITKPPLKGTKRKRKITKESDWGTYTSSSTHINAHITSYGLSGISFEIIHLCTSKSEMSYWECHYIITTGSMLSDMGLNHNISRVPTKPKGKK